MVSPHESHPKAEGRVTAGEEPGRSGHRADRALGGVTTVRNSVRMWHKNFS